MLVHEIDEQFRGETTARFRPEKKTITELIAHIVGHHHAFTRRELERLQPLGRKVVEVHGANHPELADVVKVLEELVHDLTPHMLKEETVLFPYLRKLDGIGTFSARLPDAPFGPVGNPIRMMKREHEQAGDLLAMLSELTDAYPIPEDACPSYQSFYAGLQGLERDLHEHIHVENNMLFPEAEFAERQARRR